VIERTSMRGDCRKFTPEGITRKPRRYVFTADGGNPGSTRVLVFEPRSSWRCLLGGMPNFLIKP
jgi:hypothetical protein